MTICTEAEWLYPLHRVPAVAMCLAISALHGVPSHCHRLRDNVRNNCCICVQKPLMKCALVFCVHDLSVQDAVCPCTVTEGDSWE